MDHLRLDQLPSELLLRVADALDDRDLGALRLTCKGIAAETSSMFEERREGQRYANIQTTLLDTNIDILKELATKRRFQKYVRTIRIKDNLDGYLRENGIRLNSPQDQQARLPTLPDHGSVWRRDGRGNISQPDTGIQLLRSMLVTGSLYPDTLSIVDMRQFEDPSGPDPIMELAKSILQGCGLALSSFEERHSQRVQVEIARPMDHLDPGQEFSMLRSANFRITKNISTYWLEGFLFQAPLLEILHLQSYRADSDGDRDTGGPEKFERVLKSRAPPFHLKELHLSGVSKSLQFCGAGLSAEGILHLLSKSQQSLRLVAFCGEISAGSTWQQCLASIAAGFPELNSFRLNVLKNGFGAPTLSFPSFSEANLPARLRPGLKVSTRGVGHTSGPFGLSYDGYAAASILRIACGYLQPCHA